MVPVLWTTVAPLTPAGTPLSALVLVTHRKSHACAAVPPRLPRASASHNAARSAGVVVLPSKKSDLIAPAAAAHALSSAAPPTSRTSMWPAVLSEYTPARIASSLRVKQLPSA